MSNFEIRLYALNINVPIKIHIDYAEDNKGYNFVGWSLLECCSLSRRTRSINRAESIDLHCF